MVGEEGRKVPQARGSSQYYHSVSSFIFLTGYCSDRSEERNYSYSALLLSIRGKKVNA
jgi:hypothetical protein